MEVGLIKPILFRNGNFKLHSGLESRWKVECDSLEWEDWRTLAMMAVEKLDSFGSVEAVPTGGNAFKVALREYITHGPVLICDDVFTTGKSMERQRAGRTDAIGVVAFARGVVPSWILPVWRYYR